MPWQSMPIAALAFSAMCMATVASASDSAPAPLPTGAQLTATVTALDTTLFNAYNHCDLETFGRYIAPDVEFYHDKGGVTLGRTDLVASIKRGICGKTRRELLPGTLEIYPIKDFGAVEIGTHRFCDIGTRHCDGLARFVHLWKYHDGQWTLSRVISYDHHPLAP